MENWIGKFGVIFMIIGGISAIVFMNGYDGDAYRHAQTMAELGGDIEYLTEVAFYKAKITSAFGSVVGGVLAGALLIGIGTLIDIGRERNELIRKQSGDLENAS
jgi:hypothetical protein